MPHRLLCVGKHLDLILRPDAPVHDLMSPAIEVPSTTPLRSALRTMRSERAAMAIVTTPGGTQPIGLVTLKDLVEPLTGELEAW